MYTELVYDAHIGAWTYLDIFNDESYVHKTRPRRYSIRSGFYPSEYNFLLGIRDGRIQCSYCGKFINSRSITRDHVYPKSKGGQWTTPSCYRCNTIKADKLPIEWAIFNNHRAIDV